MTTPTGFVPSDVYVAAKKRQDRLTYAPGVAFALAIVLGAVLGQQFGRSVALAYAVPLFGALVTWWVMLVKASIRTFRILRQEQQHWRPD